jgi:3',5'-cyclic-AMP phosphodiesterase
MAYLIAQVSDVHIGGHAAGSGERLSMTIDALNAMTRQVDLVLFTGDLTEHGTAEEWAEFQQRVEPLAVQWEAIPGNHDRNITELLGHRTVDLGPLVLVLLDTSADVCTPEDAAWLDRALCDHLGRPTLIALHHPPFETGIWWMDCVGLRSRELVEEVVRRHTHVLKVLSGHVHRVIQTSWGSCSLWVCPSTSVSVAADLDPAHDPSETAEGPSFSLHAFVGDSIVSHVVPVGDAGMRRSISPAAAPFVAWAREVNASRPTVFS